MALTITLTEKEKNRIFETEFLPHAEALLNFGYHLTKNDMEAEDLMQETFLKSFKSIDKYLVGTNAKAWLFSCLLYTSPSPRDATLSRMPSSA